MPDGCSGRDRGLRAAGSISKPREPPEARGLRRDEVRLLVSNLDTDSIEHARFADLPRWLSAGDLLVVNTSATMNAALPATTGDGRAFELHLSTRAAGRLLERRVAAARRERIAAVHEAQRGYGIRLPAGGQATLLAPYPLRRAPWRRARASGPRRWSSPIPSMHISNQHGFADSIRLCADVVAERDVSDRVRHRARQRGDAVGRPAVHAGAGDAAGLDRASRSRRSSCTRASRASRDHEPPYEEYLPRAAARRPSASTPPSGRAIA